MNLSGKIIWITGASSGIGKELAILCASKDAVIILSARNTVELEKVKNKLKNPSKHVVLPLDLEKNEHFRDLASDVFIQFGKIDLLINNGGLSQRSEACETSMEVDRRIMEINYFGNIALTKAVLPYMQKQKHGQILVISSIAGKFGFFLRSAYAASKHALQGFYESLMLEEEKNNIQITIAYPGKINTAISSNALTATGEINGKMDHNQATGMSAKKCAIQLLRAVEKKKKEVLIGNKETKAVMIKRLAPWLFWKIIKKQSPT